MKTMTLRQSGYTYANCSATVAASRPKPGRPQVTMSHPLGWQQMQNHLLEPPGHS